MKALPACLQLGPHVHVCEEVSWVTFQPGVPDSDCDASFEDHMIWCSGAAWLIVKLDIVARTVNLMKCIGILVGGAISIALF